jgi:hypothetical protein
LRIILSSCFRPPDWRPASRTNDLFAPPCGTSPATRSDAILNRLGFPAVAALFQAHERAVVPGFLIFRAI